MESRTTPPTLSPTRVALVTGGAGFLGSHLCRRLLKEGYQVICVDNLSTGKRAKIADIYHHPNFMFIKHDITQRFEIASKPGEPPIRIDEIYNLACVASPPLYMQNPLHTFRTSIDGVANMLALAKKHQAKLMQASTSEIYGEPMVHPQTESYRGNVNTVGERACYDEGKRGAETECYLARKRGIDARLVRIFNTYGPAMNPDDGRVVSNFIMQALTHQDITLYGDGSQTRSFCYVDDLIEGFIRLMALPVNEYEGPINLGNPNEMTVNELATNILQLLPESRSNIVRRPLPPDDPTIRKPDITQAKSKLQWSPQVDLREGLQRTITYFNSLAQQTHRHRSLFKHTYRVKRKKTFNATPHHFGNHTHLFSSSVVVRTQIQSRTEKEYVKKTPHRHHR